MVYLFKGDWKKPVEVDVLTSAAVNARKVRKSSQREEELSWSLREAVSMRADSEKRRWDQKRKRKERAEKEVVEQSLPLTSSKPLESASPPTTLSAVGPVPFLPLLTLDDVESLIDQTMYDRVAHILFLFHQRGASHLVLGFFGSITKSSWSRGYFTTC
jgi:hypothetical protein